MKTLIPVIALLLYSFTGTLHAQNVITFTENYTGGVAPTTTQKNHWNTFKSQLTPRCYSKVTLKGSNNNTGFTISNSPDVSTIADKIFNGVSFQLASGGHNWQYCATDLRIDGPAVNYCSSCNSGDCLRPLQGNENWGGLSGNTCAGGTQTITLEFTYNDAIISTIGSITGCEGDSVTLQASTGLNYQWSNGATTKDIVVDTTGNYSVIINYANGCIDTSSLIAVTINPSPEPPVIFTSNDTIFIVDDAPYVSFQWSKNSILIPGATNNYYVMDTCALYCLKVANEYGCTVTVCLPIILNDLCSTVGIVKNADANLVSLFPNPACNQITIRAASFHENDMLMVAVMNVMGKAVLPPGPVLRRGESATIDVSDLSAGIYFVQVIGERERWVGRFVKAANSN